MYRKQPLVILTRRREKTQINKIRDVKGDSQQIPMKSRGSLGNNSESYIQINWKI
jgi:hypothetical protein